jgi:hypothetical protein
MNRPKKQRQFRRYKNVGGKSTITRYEIEKDAMNIEFSNNSSFRYTNQSSGREHIAKMKELAHAGKGLDTYIKANVKDNFERKIR